jgi:hypothetical protein
LKILEELRSDVFIGLCAVFCTVWIRFLYCQTKDDLLRIKSQLPSLTQWKKQNGIHFKILYILSALMCFGWIVFGLVMEVKQSIGNLTTFFTLLLLSLACVAGLWIMYFAVYGIVKICTRKPIICLWIGIGIFVLMGLLPPCYWSKTGRFLGWHSIFYKPLQSYAKIDTSVLFTQWIMVCVVTSGLFLTFKKNQKD